MFIKFVNALNNNSYRQIPSSNMSFGLGSAQQERKKMAKMTGYSMVAVTKRIKESSCSSSEVMTDLCRNKNMLSLQSRIEIKMLTKPQNLKNLFWLQRHVTVFKKRIRINWFSYICEDLKRDCLNRKIAATASRTQKKSRIPEVTRPLLLLMYWAQCYWTFYGSSLPMLIIS